MSVCPAVHAWSGCTLASRPPAVLLLDSIGELSGLFGLADVVFMGGTLAARGGHNILEPAFFGRPVICGPHMENFRDIAEEFRAARAVVEIAAPEDLAGAVERVLADDGGAGARARECAEARRGATARAVAAMREIYRVPRYRPAVPWYRVAWALARVWLWQGGAGRRSIIRGGAEAGGAGHQRGQSHHGRNRQDAVRAPPRGVVARARTQAWHSDARLRADLARSCPGPAGGRYRAHRADGRRTADFPARARGAGRHRRGPLSHGHAAAASSFGADVMLLDDGFQHVKLARNFDIVLVDALNPFGGCEIFPLGRLREPVPGVARADAILITRSEASDLSPAIERAIRRWNPRAPVFRARIHPEWWVEHRTGRKIGTGEIKLERPGAFCGLGNPQSFYRTLEGLGIHCVDHVEFEDHHRYRPNELTRIAEQLRRRGATALVTTEKDAVNLCDGADDLLAPLPLYWLKIGMRIEGEAELLDEIERRIAG